MQTILSIIVLCTLLLLLSVLPAWERSFDTQRKVDTGAPVPTGSFDIDAGNGAGQDAGALGLVWVPISTGS